MADGDDLDPFERSLLRTNLGAEDSTHEIRGDDEEDCAKWVPEEDAAAAGGHGAVIGDGLSSQQRQVVEGRQRLAEMGGGTTPGAGPQTGPKGVKREYEEFCRMKKMEWALEKRATEDLMTRLTTGVISSTPSVSYNAAQQQLKGLVARGGAGGDDGDGDDSSDDSLLDGLDDVDGGTAGFVAQYREKRLQQLKAARPLPSFAKDGCRAVDPFEFLEEIDGADPRVAVVVLLQEDWIALCQRVAHAFEELACRFPHTRFLKMSASSCSKVLKSIDSRADLPVIMVYRAGDMEHTLMDVKEDLGDRFTAEDVEFVLRKCGALDATTEDPAAAAAAGRGGRGGVGAGASSALRASALANAAASGYQAQPDLASQGWESTQHTVGEDQVLVSEDPDTGKYLFAKMGADGSLTQV